MMTYFQRNTFLFTAWCKLLLNVLLHYVTAKSYLHYILKQLHLEL